MNFKYTKKHKMCRKKSRDLLPMFRILTIENFNQIIRTQILIKRKKNKRKSTTELVEPLIRNS